MVVSVWGTFVPRRTRAVEVVGAEHARGAVEARARRARGLQARAVGGHAGGSCTIQHKHLHIYNKCYMFHQQGVCPSSIILELFK